MDINKIYDDLCTVSDALYKNNDLAIDWINENIDILSTLITKTIEKGSDCVKEIKEPIDRLIEALENKDKLYLADIIRYEICRVIEKYYIDEICISKETIINNKEYIFNNYLEDNIENFENKKNIDKEKILDFLKNYDENNDRIAIDELGNVAVLNNNRWWRLNSFYNSSKAVEEFCSQYDLEKMYMIIIVGMANMDYVNYINKKTSDDAIILLYEPDKDIFALNCYYKNIKKILENENCHLFIEGINGKKILLFIEAYYKSQLTDNICYIISPNYNIIYKDECEEIIKDIANKIENRFINENTMILYKEHFNYNRIMNVPLILESKMLSELKKYFEQNIDFDNTPVIIVAAGPSLDKEIEKLKKVKGRAFVVAVDSSIRMLVKYGIVPDAIVTVDPNKQRILFENDIAENVPIFYCDYSLNDALKKHKSEKIFCNIDISDNYIFNEYYLCGNTGSVSNSAFIYMKYLGFKNFIFIGLNLAFLKDKKHASIVYEEKEISEEEKNMYTYVKGIDGEDLLAYNNFPYYIEAFEKEIENSNGEINFINATGEGALIKGAVNMPFQAAIKQYCKKQCDIVDLIKKCPSQEIKRNKTRKREVVKTLIKQCETREKNYREQKKLYEELLIYKNIDEVKYIINKLKKLESEMNEYKDSYIREIIEDYSKEISENSLKKMYDSTKVNDSSTDKDVKIIAESGLNVLEIYLESTETTLNLLNKCLEQV